MAINITYFDKIWASTSPLTPYTFSESNYKRGWDFVGATPPSRQMWDSIQKLNDEKLQWLYNNKLSLSGGTMTGTVIFDASNNYDFVKNGADNKGLAFIGGDTDIFSGATLQLFGNKNPSYAGQFYLRASNKTSTSDTVNQNCDLIGKPDGTLLWNNKAVERVNASGSNYIRYESGLQICWASYVSTQSSGWTVITFPIAFKSGTTPSASINSSSGSSHYYAVNSLNNTSFQTDGGGNPIHYIAVGYWK